MRGPCRLLGPWMGRLDSGRRNALVAASALFPLLVVGVALARAPQGVAAHAQGVLVFLSVSFVIGFSLASASWCAERMGADEVARTWRRAAREARRRAERLSAAGEEVGNTARALGKMARASNQGAEEQQMAVSGIASAVEELTGNVSESEEQDLKTRECAEESSRLASDGAAVVEQAVERIQAVADLVASSSEAIARLGDRSQQIGSIISTIEGIAEQTNLLALNAAIEAARAGEQGRGFAVVADEVRTLAGRSHEAANQVGERIRVIQEEVDAVVRNMSGVTEDVQGAVDLSSSAKADLQRIRESAGRTQEMIVAISEALVQQAAAIREIARHMGEFEQRAQAERAQIVDLEVTADYLRKLAEGAVGEEANR